MQLDPDYLGDGVYAEHDGDGQVWLRVGDHRNERLVALDASVLRNLIGYAKRVGILKEESK